MKQIKTMSVLALGLAATSVAQAQQSYDPNEVGTPVFISGSTAFRAQVYQGLIDLGLTADTGDSSSGNTFTFTGVISGSIVKPSALPSAFSAGLPSTANGAPNNFVGSTWTVYCSFDGSLQGIDNCLHSGNNNTFQKVGSTATFSHGTDMAFSDVSQGSATATDQSPPAFGLTEVTSDDSGINGGIAVQPFLWAANAAANTAGVTYIQDSQIYSLFDQGLADLSWWTGNSTAFVKPLALGSKTVALTGRDNSSGTRITAQQLDGWASANTINQYTINGTTSDPKTAAASLNFVSVANSGYASGGAVADALEYPNSQAAVGYISFNDAAKIQIGSTATGWTATPNNGFILSYEGINPVTTATTGSTPIVYNMAAVQNGQWPFWSYEHVYENVANGGSDNAIDGDFAPGLVYAVNYELYQQQTGAVTPFTALLEGNVNVHRSVDGGELFHN
jgi:hypothetical protein